jgi:hypothetical protein
MSRRPACRVRAGVAPASSVDRALLAELLQGRTALRRYGVNLNQPSPR